MNKKKFLSFVTVLAAVALIGFGATKAFFSDTETSKDNVLQAGKLDLKIDNESFYNGAKSPDTSWELDDLTDQLFFNFLDLKPGDTGEDTISLHVDNNDAWACMNIKLTSDDDKDCTGPEKKDDPTCSEPNSDIQDGELANQIHFIFWADDGDNVLEDNEVASIFKQGTAEDILDGHPIALADANGGVLGVEGPLKGDKTYYIGKAWCFGDLTTAPVAAGQGVDPTVNSGILCDGQPLNNAAQGDRATIDFEFSAVQARHNDGFTCEGPRVSPTATPPVSLTVTPTPPVLSCQNADVMLVLDRSGSINSTELGQLKTAGKDFVDSLTLAPSGNHAGMSSFADTGTLNQTLTDSGPTVKTAIDGLISGGFTNLKAGIDLASGELASVRDRNDITSPDKMVIITDGNPNRPLPSDTADDVAKTSADNAKAAGTEIFVVGVGSDVNTTYLQNDIATSGAGHYYSVSDYSGLKTTLDGLDLCND